MDPDMRLGQAEEDVAVDREMYQCLVGRLIYLFYTRPNIEYAVSMTSQIIHNLREVYLQEAH